MISDFKAVKHTSNDIVKIVSGGVLLWEREKKLIIKWEKKTETQSYVGGFSPEEVYSEYEIKDGKFYGIGRKTNYLGNSTYYKLVDGSRKMEKLVYKKSEKSYSGREELYFYVYIGTLVYEYIS